jgi:hypothetical protein
VDEFFDRCLPQRNGRPLGRRARQKYIRKYGIKVIWLGRSGFVDEQFEADRLRKIAQQSPGLLPRGPGRPPKAAKAAGGAA